MDFTPSVILYHVYIVNNWKTVSETLLRQIPHDDIIININIDLLMIWKLPYVMYKLNKISKVHKIVVTINSKKDAEARALRKLRASLKTKNYVLATYLHGKGVTKPDNPNIKDWVELMRHFLIDRMDLCHEAFKNGYKMYGVNLSHYDPNKPRYGPFKLSDFHYAGNFVTVNLIELREKMINTPIDVDYFGVEGFWGKLCLASEAYSAHTSNVDHYLNPYHWSNYKTDY